MYNRGNLKAKKTLDEFEIYLQNNRIFLKPEIEAKFDEIAKRLESIWINIASIAFVEKESRIELFDEAVETNEEIGSFMKEIEEIIQGELFPEKEAKQS